MTHNEKETGMAHDEKVMATYNLLYGDDGILKCIDNSKQFTINHMTAIDQLLNEARTLIKLTGYSIMGAKYSIKYTDMSSGLSVVRSSECGICKDNIGDSDDTDEDMMTISTEPLIYNGEMYGIISRWMHIDSTYLVLYLSLLSGGGVTHESSYMKICMATPFRERLV